MDRGKPSPKGDLRPKPPKWSSPFWYLPIMLLVLWMWQSMIVQFAYRAIPYSDFKLRLQNHEVTECVVKDDAIEGKIEPKPEASPEKTVRAADTNTAPSSKS